MRIIGFQSKDTVILQAGFKELKEITGITDSSKFEEVFGVTLYYGSVSESDSSRKKIIEVEDYPVSEVYRQARETLSEYRELKTKFESIRNQLTNLLKKMDAFQNTEI